MDSGWGVGGGGLYDDRHLHQTSSYPRAVLAVHSYNTISTILKKKQTKKTDYTS